MTTATKTCSHTDALREFAELVREMREAEKKTIGAKDIQAYQDAVEFGSLVDDELSALPAAPGWCPLCQALHERDEARRAVADLMQANGVLMNERDAARRLVEFAYREGCEIDSDRPSWRWPTLVDEYWSGSESKRRLEGKDG